MPGPYTFIHRRLEDVIKLFITQITDFPATIYLWSEITAAGDSVKEPFIGIRCASSTPGIPEVQLDRGYSIRNAQLQIVIRSHAEDQSPELSARDFHENLVGTLLDTFYREDILTALNAQCSVVGNIGIDQIDQPDIADETEQRSYRTMITFPILCHPNPD